jgi:hypothetical protein
MTANALATVVCRCKGSQQKNAAEYLCFTQFGSFNTFVFLQTLLQRVR